MHKIWKIMTMASALVLTGGALMVGGAKDSVATKASVTSAQLQIAVVRPTFWGTANAWQVLRIASSASTLENDDYSNITYCDNFVYYSDSFYSDGGFQEYTTDGILIYKVDISDISGMYFDLARLSTSDPSATVWNTTGTYQFSDGLNNGIWRIYGNGGGIAFAPASESENIDNSSVDAILGGYLTCDPSVNNGYGAYGTLNTNYNLATRTFTSSDTVSDYDYMDGAYDYSEPAGEFAVSVLASDKVAAMQSLYNASQASGAAVSNSKDNSLEIISIIGVAGLTLLGGYYFLNKKKIDA